MSTEAQNESNRRNAEHSTGPRTEEGKAASCLNNFKYGFCGAFTVLEAESQQEFDSLLTSLRLEHVPATPTENILVDRMAQHFWLGQRAQLLQSMSMSGDRPDPELEKSFALYLRYQTANDRAFSKCLHDLIKLRAEKRKAESDQAAFLRKQAEELRKQETHQIRVRTAAVKIVASQHSGKQFSTLHQPPTDAPEQAAGQLNFFPELQNAA